VGRSLWREDGSVVYNCSWPLPVQTFSGPTPMELVTINKSLNYVSPFYKSGTNWIEITISYSFSIVLVLIRSCGNFVRFLVTLLVLKNYSLSRNASSRPLSSNERLLRCFSDCTLPAFRRYVTIFTNIIMQSIFKVSLSIGVAKQITPVSLNLSGNGGFVTWKAVLLTSVKDLAPYIFLDSVTLPLNCYGDVTFEKHNYLHITHIRRSKYTETW
jgi:hypothetical protein